MAGARAEHPGAGDVGSQLRILVVRSGGVAGLTQRWSVDRPDPADEWVALVDACPWDEVGDDAVSRDRFVWRIEARTSQRDRAASVPDSRLTGPWRELVDRVRTEGSGA